MFNSGLIKDFFGSRKGIALVNFDVFYIWTLKIIENYEWWMWTEVILHVIKVRIRSGEKITYKTCFTLTI